MSKPSPNCLYLARVSRLVGLPTFPDGARDLKVEGPTPLLLPKPPPNEPKLLFFNSGLPKFRGWVRQIRRHIWFGESQLWVRFESRLTLWRFAAATLGVGNTSLRQSGLAKAPSQSLRFLELQLPRQFILAFFIPLFRSFIHVVKLLRWIILRSFGSICLVGGLLDGRLPQYSALSLKILTIRFSWSTEWETTNLLKRVFRRGGLDLQLFWSWKRSCKNWVGLRGNESLVCSVHS